MRKFLFILSLISTSFLVAEDQQPVKVDTPEMRTIFHKNYLDAEDQLDFFYLMASKVIEETNSSLTPSELVNRFKEFAETPEIENRYLTIYASHFNDEEAKKVCELIDNDLYLKYRQSLTIANFKCYQETLNNLKELALTIDRAPTQGIRDIIRLTSDNLQQVLSSPESLIIDIYTDWCGPCQHLSPIVKELNDEYGHLYRFAKLNAEQEGHLVSLFRVRGFPTILFIKDGKEVGRHVGFMNKEKFLSKIQSYFDK